jgi:tRNA(fMet)-specific endonuclease VapC
LVSRADDPRRSRTDGGYDSSHAQSQYDSLMPFLLDTSTCSQHLKSGDDTPILARMVQHSGQLYVSRLTVAELYAFAFRGSAKRVREFDQFFDDMHILEFTDQCAREDGKTHAFLADRGIRIGAIDLMLASTAVVNELVLITHDRDFDHLKGVVPGLTIDDWLPSKAGGT